MIGASKQHILSEIRRTAEANGGAPLGRRIFFQETGIKVSDWHGKIWARWGDALQEAGFQPNGLQTAYRDEMLIGKFTELVRALGHYPVSAEIRMRARSDNNFPSHNAFARFGSKQQLAMRILDYCNDRSDYADVAALCAPVAALRNQHNHQADDNEPQVDSTTSVKAGYVYMALLKMGRELRYKIGKAVLVERRADQISLQLPADLELVHAINTDDAYGIEDYWHRRFAAKNTKGEWFRLSREDVGAFKRRKFM